MIRSAWPFVARSWVKWKSNLNVLENLHFDFRSHSFRSDFFHLTRFDTFRLWVLHRWRAREGHIPIILISFGLWVDSNLYNILDPQRKMIVARCVAEGLDRVLSFLSIHWLVKLTSYGPLSGLFWGLNEIWNTKQERSILTINCV